MELREGTREICLEEPSKGSKRRTIANLKADFFPFENAA